MWRASGAVLGEADVRLCIYSRPRAPRSHVFNVCHPRAHASCREALDSSMEETIFAQTELEGKEANAKRVIALFDILLIPCTTYGFPLPLLKILHLTCIKRLREDT